jgi:radical SAM protein with 4Fe4S-binding SPASM domain
VTGASSLRLLPATIKPSRRLAILQEPRDEDRRWHPVYAVWEITLQCDLLCHHCGSRAGKRRPDELDTKQCLDVVDQLADMGTHEVSLIGGEAYLRDDWLQIIEAITRRGMTCTMTTGGRALTRERAVAARQAGLKGASVSLDGLREFHDDVRGVRGAFDAALDAIAHLKAAGVPVSANTQLTRPGLRDVPALFGVLVAAGIHAWQVQLTVAMGRAADRPELLLEPWQMLEVLAMLHRLKPRADEAGVRIWAGNNIGYFGPYEHELRGHLPQGHRGSCGAGRSTLGIEANGDIKGCPSLPSADYVGGNVRDHSLRTIWEQTAPLRFTRDRTVADLWGPCATCYYADTCKAGCNWTSHVLFGRPGNNPFCHHRALELLRDGKRERLVKVAEAPNEPFDQARFQVVVEDWPPAQLAAARKLADSGDGWID